MDAAGQCTSVNTKVQSSSKGKPKASSMEGGLCLIDDHLYGASRGWKDHRSADDVRSVGENSSRKSSSSKTSNSSSDHKSSRTRRHSSQCHSTSGSSISSSRSSTGSRRKKRSVSCIRTVLSDEEVGHGRDEFRSNISLSSTNLKGYDNDATSPSNGDLLSRSVPSSPLASWTSPATGNLRDYDRVKTLWGNGFDLLDERKRGIGRKLGHQRSSTNMFHSKAKNESGLANSKELQSILIDIHVIRSPGPIRFVVKKNESVKQVINLVLQAYKKQKREPSLGPSHQQFILYCNNPEFEAMEEDRLIGDYGPRRFYLHPKSDLEEAQEEVKRISPTIRGFIVANKRCSILSRFEKRFAKVQSWSSSLMDTFSRNFGQFSSSFRITNLYSIMLQAWR